FDQQLGLAIIAGLISGTLAWKSCWTEWFDRDDPSGSGDWELLSDLRKEYPGKVCDKPVDIEVQTLSGLTPDAAGDVVDKDKGFVCKNVDQKGKMCDDYRVRFSCYSPFCAEEVCWTEWFDRDDASGTGDWEGLSDLQKQYPGKICKKPKYIEVVTVSGDIPATATGQDFLVFNPTEGFVCKNGPGQYCQDYKVRFGCCCE
uniref:WxxW domain-containing protein n=1 Tax=Periophthalmus magnuspinnatus TaxID=409849 RepID=A0A3B3ZEP0_9GOBI